MGVLTMVRKINPRDPRLWLVVAFGLVCITPSTKPPVDAQAVVSDPNPRPVMRSGAGAPSGPTGDAGDWYVNSSATTLYGPKAAPSTWPGPISMVGANGTNGATGPAGPSTIGAPTTRSLSFATAYQATDPSKAAVVTINFTSTANISLSGGTTNSATVVIGPTNAVASGTGSVLCPYSNSNTGTLTIGLNLSTVATASCVVVIPAGYYFAPRQTAGTVTISSSFDQSIG